jgi:DNA repair photolyase
MGHYCRICGRLWPNEPFSGRRLDFETKIMVKENAPELLRKQLSAPKWKPQKMEKINARRRAERRKQR